jgi:hypothetical protein
VRRLRDTRAALKRVTRTFAELSRPGRAGTRGASRATPRHRASTPRSSG